MRHIAAAGFVGLGEPWASIVIGLIAIAVITWIAILVTTLKNVFRSPMDTSSKVMWVVIVMATHLLGVLLWHFVGRRQTSPAAG